jgi:TPP-dependent pyruvate/acetoin dehydrogenase alpha subunit
MDAKAKDIVSEAVKLSDEAPYPAGEEAAYPVYFEEVLHD